MLEFFAREPLNFPLVEKTTIIPIPVGDDISSLSGILLDENYYSFIRSLRRTVVAFAFSQLKHFYYSKHVHGRISPTASRAESSSKTRICASTASISFACLPRSRKPRGFTFRSPSTTTSPISSPLTSKIQSTPPRLKSA